MYNKKTLIFILILFTSQAFGQVKNSFNIKLKKEKYLKFSPCIYSFDWESIQMKNKQIEKKINGYIKANIYEYLNSTLTD